MVDDEAAVRAWLLAEIRGEHGLGPGISSYPRLADDNQRRVHALCVGLERSGLIHRQIDEPDHVLWMPGG